MVQTPTTNSRLSLMNSPLHLGLRLTPTSHNASNSPYTPTKGSPLRSPVKPGPRAELGFALKQVIGATASSKNAFDAHESCFAFTAGAAAVIATYNEETENVEQSFYRARPTALPLNPTPVVYEHGTPTAPESRNRTAAPLRSAGGAISPFGTPNSDWGDTSSGKTWSAKERVKAATCVSFSSNGRFLAVGEVFSCPDMLTVAVLTNELRPATNHVC